MIYQIKRAFVLSTVFGIFGVLNAGVLDDCIAAYEAGDLVKAESLCTQSVKANKNSFYANIYASTVLLEKGEYKKALPYAKKAESLAKALDDYRVAYNKLAIIYGVLGDKKEDLKYTQKNLDIALKTGNNDKIATAYNNLGAYYYGLDKLDDALKYYNKALEYASKPSDMYTNIGNIYYQQENYELSLKNALKAIEINVDNGDYRREARSRVPAAASYIELKKYDLAEDMLSKALVISKREGLIDIEAYSLMYYGYLYTKKDDKTKAKEYLTRAYEMYNKVGDKDGAKDCMYMMDKLKDNK